MVSLMELYDILFVGFYAAIAWWLLNDGGSGGKRNRVPVAFSA
jgi:hypothetical protein